MSMNSKIQTAETRTHTSVKTAGQLTLVLLSGAMLPLCFPPYGWWPLLLVSLPVLLFALEGTTPRRAFYLGMLQGMVGYGISLYWLFNIFSATAISLYAIMASFTGLFCVLFSILAKRTRAPVLNVLLAATLWTAIEFYRSELFVLRFPWITPGSALGPTFLSPVVGVYGTSFVIMAASACFLRRKTLTIGLILVISTLFLGFIHPPRIDPPAEGGVRVTVVQSEESYLPTYVDLTRSEHANSPDLVIWPEYALPYDVRQSPSQMAALTNLCAEMGVVLVLGTKTPEGLAPKAWRNTALVLDQSGELGEYFKARPVHFFNDGIPGHEFSPMQTRLGRFATPICFDCDYTAVARRMAVLGAEFFAVPSFDAEAWSANQHLQHAIMFRLRAAETGRWLACAASSGVSQIIDPHGNVHQSLPPMEVGTLTYPIGKETRLTFFVRIGWLFPWLTLVSSAIAVTVAAVREARRSLSTSLNSRAHPPHHSGKPRWSLPGFLAAMKSIRSKPRLENRTAKQRSISRKTGSTFVSTSSIEKSASIDRREF